ncbi:phosphatidic acid phosphatase type 2/haloperoxidase [Lentinula raphanica]|nr:phosphatidic acid phosphatase type 2/haloperoxidase [Lentinula raphanica]
MASHYIDTEPSDSEWQLPFYLKFLDKTNSTVISITACFLLYTQSSGVAYFASGVAACIMAVKMVKKLIRQERPVMERPGNQKRKTYGMPSTHSTTSTFYATYILLAAVYLPIHQSLPQNSMTRVLSLLIALPWATMIALSRLWLGHHTPAQVSVGCTLGFCFAWLWFHFWASGLNEYGFRVEQFWRSRSVVWK